MIFRPGEIEAILSGRKTQTRRFNNGYKIGRLYEIQPGRGKRGIGKRIRVINVRKERLGDISEEDARAEGYSSIDDFKGNWTGRTGNWVMDQEVYVIIFELLDEAASGQEISSICSQADRSKRVGEEGA